MSFDTANTKIKCMAIISINVFFSIFFRKKKEKNKQKRSMGNSATKDIPHTEVILFSAWKYPLYRVPSLLLIKFSFIFLSSHKYIFSITLYCEMISQPVIFSNLLVYVSLLHTTEATVFNANCNFSCVTGARITP